MNDPEEQLNTLKKLMWLHDSYWHASAVHEIGPERANRLNLAANQRFFRKYTLMLLKTGAIKRPRSVEELMAVFKKIWKDCFFDDMYVNEPVSFDGNRATWTGSHCNAFDSLSKAGMTGEYVCGCQAIRDGVMKALRLKPIHSIEKSLVRGDGCCVISFTFDPK
jgi:hypothetical protein